jgi:hypothetical protein
MAAAHRTVLQWNGVGGIKRDGGDQDVLCDCMGEYGFVMTTVSIPASRRDEFSVHSPCESSWLYEENSGR